MSPRRFKLEIDGCMFFCAAFENQVELDQALGSALHVAPQTEPAPAADDTRPPGRPSFSETIGEAVQAVSSELEGLPSIAARARRVLRQIAQTAAAGDIPSRDTVERFLRDRPARQNSRQNFPQKSGGRTLKPGG